VTSVAKGKYHEWLEPDNLLRLSAWARDGLTDADIADNMDINVSTLYEWKKKYPKISEALSENKEVADIKVENALFKKCKGFKTTIRRAFKLKDVIYKDGKRIKETERIEYAEEEIYIPPDTAAIKFWLINRKNKKWKSDPDKDNSNIEPVKVQLVGELDELAK